MDARLCRPDILRPLHPGRGFRTDSQDHPSCMRSDLENTLFKNTSLQITFKNSTQEKDFEPIARTIPPLLHEKKYMYFREKYTFEKNITFEKNTRFDIINATQSNSRNKQTNARKTNNAEEVSEQKRPQTSLLKLTRTKAVLGYAAVV